MAARKNRAGTDIGRTVWVDSPKSAFHGHAGTVVEIDAVGWAQVEIVLAIGRTGVWFRGAELRHDAFVSFVKESKFQIAEER